MKFEIFYCRPCGYAGRADDLATELCDRFGAEVAVEEGKFGQFDIAIARLVSPSSTSYYEAPTLRLSKGPSHKLATPARSVINHHANRPGGTFIVRGRKCISDLWLWEAVGDDWTGVQSVGGQQIEGRLVLGYALPA